jgi:Bacterial SH3 domain
MTDRDPFLARALSRRPVPDHDPGFWSDLERQMAGDGRVPAAAPQPRGPWLPLLAAAALLVVAAVAAVLVFRDDPDSEQVQAGPDTSAETDASASAPPSTSPDTSAATASTAAAVPSGPVDLGTGVLAGVSRSGAVAWILDPDPAADTPGCEGEAANRLWATRVLDGTRVPATADPAIAGNVVTGPDGRVAVVAGCEGYSQGLWIGTTDADGVLDVVEVPLGDDLIDLLGQTVRFAPNGSLTAVLRDWTSAEPGPGRLVEIDPTTLEQSLVAEDDIWDGGVLSDGTVVLAGSTSLRIGTTSVADLNSQTGASGFALGDDRVAIGGTELQVFAADGSRLASYPAESGFAYSPGAGGVYVQAAFSADGRRLVALAAGEGGYQTRVFSEDDDVFEVPPPGFIGRIHVTDAGYVLGTTADVRVAGLPIAVQDTGAAPPTTTTAPVTTTTGLAGEAFDGPAPAAGEAVSVVGVASGDVLNVRSGPGTDQEIVATLAPDATAVATGSARLLPESLWFEVEAGGTTGWASAAFLSQAGLTDDATAEITAAVGPLGADTLPDLAERLRDWLEADEPIGSLTVVAGPSEGDLGEITVDALGLRDDAIEGFRLHVFAERTEGGSWALRTVERTYLCARGVDDAGRCL